MTDVAAGVVVDASVSELTVSEGVTIPDSWALTSVSWVKRMAREKSVRMRAGLAGHRMIEAGGGEKRRTSASGAGDERR